MRIRIKCRKKRQTLPDLVQRIQERINRYWLAARTSCDYDIPSRIQQAYSGETLEVSKADKTYGKD